MAKFLQPYQEALKERMTPFTPEERAALLLALDDEDFENDPMPDEVLPKPPQRYQVASLSSTEDGLVGTSMAGAEMFRIAIGQRPEQLTAQTLLELAADALCVPICCLTLWQGGKEVSGLLEDVSSLTLREVVQDDVRPLICRRPAEEGRSDAMLGEGMVELELDCLPQDGAIQAIAEARRFVTSEEACWLIYTRKEVVSYRFKSGVVLEAEGYFPLPPVWRLPKTAKQWGNSDCDVWSASVAIPVRSLLDEHAQQTNDKPIPRYQMIVDPNQFVHDSDAEGGPVWVPMEVDITSSDGPRAHLVGGDLSHAEPRLAQEGCDEIYVFAILFTDAVLDHLSDIIVTGTNPADIERIEEMKTLFGTVYFSISTLFQSISNGLDWGEAALVLSQVGVLWVLVYNLYIAFTSFVLLNVLTGVFCNSAIKAAESDHEMVIQSLIYSKKNFQELVENLFHRIDDLGLGMITISEFERHFNDVQVRAFFESLEMGAVDAWTLFASLDADGDNVISLQDFSERCVQLHGPARSVDLYSLKQLTAKLRQELQLVSDALLPAGDLRGSTRGLSKERGTRRVSPPMVATVSDEQSKSPIEL
ncbi:Sodium channel protein [Durusdinium trenchii]|uniref:Sodium channel protein n=1 Tax=Durusdinium trenchii TaxID=1381693 RepID=A0ABP0N5X1_9DINO